MHETNKTGALAHTPPQSPKGEAQRLGPTCGKSRPACGTEASSFQLLTSSYKTAFPQNSLSLTSNETLANVDVYFDDLKITHYPSPIVQEDDYYPFGLTFNSYQLALSKKNNYLYNGGTERIDELGLGWDKTPNRIYAPDLGRFWGNDALTDLFPALSPSTYSYNNPIKFFDPTGLSGNETDTLKEVVITAKRINNTSRNEKISSMTRSLNPIYRSVGIKIRMGDKNWLRNAFKRSNQTIKWSGYKGQTEWGKDFNNVVGGIYVGVGGTMLVAFGSPVLIESLGTSSFSLNGSFSIKSIAIRAGIEAGSQSVINVAAYGWSGLGNLDVADVGLSAVGLNYVGSSLVGSTANWTPFSKSGTSFSYLGNGISVSQALTGFGTSMFSGWQRTLMNKTTINKGVINMFDAFNQIKIKGLGELINTKTSDE